MKKAILNKTSKKLQTSESEPPQSDISSASRDMSVTGILRVPAPTPAISVLGLDNNIPIHGKLVNKFTQPEYTITEISKGNNTWYEIRNSNSVIMVPINRVAYVIFAN